MVAYPAPTRLVRVQILSLLPCRISSTAEQYFRKVHIFVQFKYAALRLYPGRLRESKEPSSQDNIVL